MPLVAPGMKMMFPWIRMKPSLDRAGDAHQGAVIGGAGVPGCQGLTPEPRSEAEEKIRLLGVLGLQRFAPASSD